jgi:hypothetical protein
MFVSKYLRNQLLDNMTPSVYLPSIDAFNNGIDVWSMVPLTLGQAQQCDKREKLLKEEIISLNENINLLTQENENIKNLLSQEKDLNDYAYQAFLRILEVPQLPAEARAEAVEYVQRFEKLRSPEELQKLQAAATKIESDLNTKEETVKQLITPPNTYGPESWPYYIDPDEPPQKKIKTEKGGGVITRSMAMQQQQLNNQIINSFEVLDNHISKSRNYIAEATQWLLSHGIQLPPQYLTAAQNLINNPDSYEPVAARTRSKLLALNQTSKVAAAHREVKAISRQVRGAHESVKTTIDANKARRVREDVTKGMRATKKGDQLAKLRQRAGRKLTRKYYKSKNPKNMEKIFKNLKI